MVSISLSHLRRVQKHMVFIFPVSILLLSALFGSINPDIRWNTEGAFIGTATNGWLDDTSSLVFETFLAAPLLDISGLYTERKFSGSTTARASIDVVGSAIDAYAHHVLVDSNGTLLLTDLQGMLFKYS